MRPPSWWTGEAGAWDERDGERWAFHRPPALQFEYKHQPKPILECSRCSPRKKRSSYAKRREAAVVRDIHCLTVMTMNLVFPAATVAVVVGFTVAAELSQCPRTAREFMREKLELSQRALERLATENHDLNIAMGTRLSAMSKEAGGRLFENPDYDQQGVTFRRHVDSLARAAKARDLDAATPPARHLTTAQG